MLDRLVGVGHVAGSEAEPREWDIRGRVCVLLQSLIREELDHEPKWMKMDSCGTGGASQTQAVP